MPYHVKRDDRCPVTRPFGVIKDSDDEVMGCHPSQAAADRQMAALYANDEQAARAADPAFGTFGHAIMHPDPAIRAKAGRFVDGLPDLPPPPGGDHATAG